MIGTTIGNYRIVEKLGAGGMGEVYRAVDTVLEREVALKSLHPFLTQDEGRLERFRSEAVTLARLNHPNIAILHNFFSHGEVYYMVMEYVQGENFESLIRRYGRVPLRRTLEMFIEALKGFEHAHSKQVVHRDIKPANLMLNAENVVKITDFGIARVVGGERLTQTGKLIGTLEYMSPEQVRGDLQDERSDIYSLGILLYEMVSGQVPFSSASDFEIMRSHLEAAPRSLRELSGDVPPEVESIISKALQKDPAQRFATAREMRKALEPVLATLPANEPEIVPQLRETREANVVAVAGMAIPATGEAAAPVGVSAAASGAAPPPTRADVSAVPGAGRSATKGLPAWLNPRVAMAGAAALLLVIALSAAAMRFRAPAADPEQVKGGQTTQNVNDVRKSDTPGVADVSHSDVPPVLPPVSSMVQPQPKITPLPVPTATPKPKPKPTARPTAKPRPKAAAPRKRTVRPAPKRATTRTAPTRRSRPKPKSVRRSKPRKSGGGGKEAALKAAIKGN